jgi:hypothetical protein
MPALPPKAARRNALGQHLPHETGGGGAQRGAYAHLPAPPRGARQQQIGHVGADQQQHGDDHVRHQPERSANVSDDLFEQGHGRELPPRVRVGISGRELTALRIESGARLLDRYGRAEPREHW